MRSLAVTESKNSVIDFNGHVTDSARDEIGEPAILIDTFRTIQMMFHIEMEQRPRYERLGFPHGTGGIKRSLGREFMRTSPF
jgi:hypothetical protein